MTEHLKRIAQAFFAGLAVVVVLTLIATLLAHAQAFPQGQPPAGAITSTTWGSTPTLVSAFLTAPQVTAGANATLVNGGEVRRLVYKATVSATTCVAPFQAAALTADCTLATLPAKVRVVGVYADVTAGWTCSGTCTGTKVFQVGTAVAGTQILAAGLNVAVTGQFGLLDADLGSGMTRAAAIQGGQFGSWTTTTVVSARFTSGTGNWGSGAATFVNAGSTDVYLETLSLP